MNAGVFYYLLENIHAMFRSSLQAIQLVAIAKASDIHTYGCMWLTATTIYGELKSAG